MGEVTEMLRTASDKLAEGPHRWTKGATSRNKYGGIFPVKKADSWCALGIIRWAAIQHGVITGEAGFSVSMGQAENILAEVAEVINLRSSAASSIPIWNDEIASYEQVLETFQKAVKAADERGL